jgi:signal transduction histidine kinase
MLRATSCVFERRMKSLADSLRADAALGESNVDELVANVARRAAGVHELATELAAIAECPLEEATTEIDVAAVVREAVAANDGRAGRQGVAVLVDVPPSLRLRSKREAVALLVRMLVSHGVAATPRDGAVSVSCFRTEIGIALRVEDGGPSVAEAAREALLRLGADPSGLGRPTGIALLAASAVAGRLGAVLELRQGPGGGAETWVLVSDG